MKAISPMIAVVLLIAFTIAVGGIVNLFLTGLTKTQTETTTEVGDKVLRCGNSYIQIDEVKTDSDLNPVNITLTYLQSPTNEDLYNFRVYIIDSNGHLNSTSDLTPNYTPSNPLKVGQQTIWSINTTDWGLSGSLQSVRVQGLCQTDYPVTDECKAAEPCLK